MTQLPDQTAPLVDRLKAFRDMVAGEHPNEIARHYHELIQLLDDARTALIAAIETLVTKKKLVAKPAVIGAAAFLVAHK